MKEDKYLRTRVIYGASQRTLSHLGDREAQEVTTTVLCEKSTEK